MIVQKVTNR